MALTREQQELVEQIAHETAIRAVLRHEQRFQLQGWLVGELLGICGEVFRRVAGLDAVAWLVGRLG